MELIKEIGAFAGLAAFFGLALLALLSFTHGRDIRRLREWAGLGAGARRRAQGVDLGDRRAARRGAARAWRRPAPPSTQAVELREERRQRREAGLPELTRGERLRERFSGSGRPARRAALPGRRSSSSWS